MTTDLVIIGAGPAGLTAAIYGLRGGLKVVVFDKLFYGGQVAVTSEVENYPAIEKISGFVLSEKIYKQAVAQGAEIRFEEVQKVELEGTVKRIVTAADTYEARAVIIANGAQRRKLGCEGEERLTGNGVSYCATCDGAFFRKKEVAVIGGGNTALEDALFLSNLCSKVTLVVRGTSFRGEKPMVRAVEERENIQVLFGHTVERIIGEKTVSALVVRDKQTGEEKELTVQGVFVAIGLQPDNSLFEGQIQIDQGGYIVAGETCETSLPGVYAAGDSRTKPLRQIITAAADGAVAAYTAANYVNLEKEKIS